MQEVMIRRAKELLAARTVDRVLGWQRGAFGYDVTPALFTAPQMLDADFVYDAFCGVNLSKYLVAESRKEGKTLAFLKPCDTYSLNQLIAEHRVARDRVYIIGTPCGGKIDAERLWAAGVTGVTNVTETDDAFILQTANGPQTMAKADALAERCLTCKSKKCVVYDELAGENGEVTAAPRFDRVRALERMTPDQRYAFWQGELSRCIRCNACRNVCPACTCEQCVFDDPRSGVTSTAPSHDFEEKLFHVIRAFHVAGRCTDCGECTRVCPQHIPLHLLNRKLILDINDLYGPYQAGADPTARGPLTDFAADDCDPSAMWERGVERP